MVEDEHGKRDKPDIEPDTPDTQPAQQPPAGGSGQRDGGGGTTRRQWLSRVMIGGGVAAGVGLLAPVVSYLIAPAFRHPRPVWQTVGPVNQFQVGHTVRVVFENISPVPWSGQVGEAAAWLRRSGPAQFTAFSINCTHLGCPVRWLSGAKLFLCPCHGGVYYQDGKVAAGPPPRPLPQYPVREQGGLVQIRTSPLPITTTT